MKENHYKGVQSAILRGSGLVILFMIMSVLVISCDENNTDSGSLRAVLSVRESPNVPGRIELDPRGSKPGAGDGIRVVHKLSYDKRGHGIQLPNESEIEGGGSNYLPVRPSCSDQRLFSLIRYGAPVILYSLPRLLSAPVMA